MYIFKYKLYKYEDFQTHDPIWLSIMLKIK